MLALLEIDFASKLLGAQRPSSILSAVHVSF
jgi:hypothetical protein